MRTDHDEPIFISGSLMRHVAVMAFTSSIGIMAIFAVDLIDMIFISMLGSEALAAAVGYASTLLFFTNSVSMGLSIAAGALVARALGKRKKVEAREYAISVAAFTAVAGCIVPAILLPNIDSLLGLLGASGSVAEKAASYLWIIMPSMAVMGVAMTGMAVLRAYGDARRSMYVTLFGGITNAVLDPIFIFTFALDLQGAAIASVIARFVMLFLAIGQGIRHHDAFIRPSFKIFARDASAVLTLAIPAVLTNVATPVGAAILTREISYYGTDAVAGMAVIGRLTPVAFAVVLALSGAVGPIIGQNFGAGLTDRVKQTLIESLKFIGIFVLFATLILFVLRGPIADVFEARGMTRTLIFLFCGPLALVYFFNGAIFAANAAFNNLGHPLYSTWINWGKNTLGTLPFVLVGGALWGAPGILIGQAAGSILFAFIAIFLAMKVISGQKVERSAQPIIQPAMKTREDDIIASHRRW